MPRRSSIELPIPADPLRGNFVSLREQIRRGIVDGLAGVKPATERADEILESLREKCRQGNPFPLVAYQWPQLVLTDEQEVAIFQKHMRPDRFERLTERSQEVLADPTNPPLRLDWWQKIVLAGYFDPAIREVNIKGCTGAGKGLSTSLGFCLWYDVYDECRIYLTGRDHDHAIKTIFLEVKRWFMRMKHPAHARVLGESIGNGEKRYIKVLNPSPTAADAGEAFSGQHGSWTIYGMDEATSHPDVYFENASKNALKIVRLANPRHRLGSFYRAFEKMGVDRIDEIGTCFGVMAMRLNITVGATDCMNVAEGRLKNPVAPAGGITVNGRSYEEGKVIKDADYQFCKPLIPEQIDVAQFHTALSQPLSDCFAHGRFPKEDPEKQIILQSWLPRHFAAWNDGIPVTCFGLDVARSLEGDRTVLAAGSDVGCRALHEMRIPDATEVADEVLRLAFQVYGIDLKAGKVPVCIDYGGGYGAGAGDYLRKLGVWVMEFQPGGGSQFPRNYANLRTEGYATLGVRLDPAQPQGAEPWALPPAAEGLAAELTAPEKVFSPADMVRFRVLPKDEIKRLLGRSPDLADAVTYLFHAVRELYALNEWFAQSHRPLLVYPSPSPAPPDESTQQPPEKVDHTQPQPGDDPTLAFLREQYGSIFNGDLTPPKPPVTTAVEEKPKGWIGGIDWGD